MSIFIVETFAIFIDDNSLLSYGFTCYLDSNDCKYRDVMIIWVS